MTLSSILLYVRDIEAMVSFYEKHFGFTAKREDGDRLVQLTARDGGADLVLHQAAKSQKMGQVLVKLVFDIRDVEEFCARSKAKGLVFGAIHKADGYVFANAKDPNNNPICVSSRAFRPLRDYV